MGNLDVERWAAEAIDAIGDIYGRHEGDAPRTPRARCCAATFTATGAAAELSRAAHLQGGRSTRGCGSPTAAATPTSRDGAVDGRGMAVTFDLPDGTATDIVALTLPVFFVRTPEDFLAFTRARKPDPETGQPDFAQSGSSSRRTRGAPGDPGALGAQGSASSSTCTYNCSTRSGS